MLYNLLELKKQKSESQTQVTGIMENVTSEAQHPSTVVYYDCRLILGTQRAIKVTVCSSLLGKYKPFLRADACTHFGQFEA